MKFVFLLLAVSALAAAATSLQFTENKENAELNVQLSFEADQHDELLQRFRRDRTPAPEPPKPFLTNRFKNKHVARASDLRFHRRVGSSTWKRRIERFATTKARDGYKRTGQPIRNTLPVSLSIIEMRNRNDMKALRDDFKNRPADDFVTDHSYKVHEFSKNDDGITYNFEKTDSVKLELGVDRNDEINHYAGSVKCRDNGRRRQGRSVFRVGSQLCVRTWINPAPRDTSDSGDRGSSSSGSSSSSSSDSSSGTTPRRCPRGFRRVGQKCQRIRRQQG